jgi:hypothetical protein
MFPPSVAMLRICGVATSEAACASAVNPFRKRGSAAMSESVRHAPSRKPDGLNSISLKDGMWRRLISVRGTCCRLFMFGSRSVPPASGMALALSPSRMRVASSSVCGARNSKSGSRIMAPVPAPSPGEVFACGERRSPRCRRHLPMAAGRAVPRANGRAGNGSVQNAGHAPLSFRQGPS